jgi:opacity protein-like surface antigen
LKILTTASCCAFLFAGALRAQSLTEAILDRVNFNVGGGIDQNFLTTKTNLAGGINVQGGVGYNVNSHLGVMLHIEYDRQRITGTALDLLGTPQGFPSGKVKFQAITFDPVWHFFPKKTWDAYVTGGGGAVQRTQHLATPIAATATGLDPFFGFNNPGYPSSTTNLGYTVTKPVLDVAAGVSYKVKWNFKAYAEVRYNHAFMGSLGHMDWAPVSVGVRW